MFGLDDVLGGIGSVAGYFGGQDDRDAANNAILDSINEYKKLNPTVTAALAPTSAYASLDPATRAAQMDTLAQLRGEISSGGMDALDRARVNDITNATAQAGRVASAGAVQDAARRGLTGAAGLVSGQVAGQQAAQAGQQAGTQAAALAEQQRQQEIAQQGSQAGQVRQQDQTGAAAQDAIEKFNAAQKQGAQQQTFSNAATRAAGIAGANGQQYNAQEADAQRLQNLGKAAGQTVGGIANYFANPAAKVSPDQFAGFA
jgi:hypothetical protein